eukprot:RCo006573
MTKGTPSFGGKNIKSHVMCKRCGRRSYHAQKKKCASCGYPNAKIRKYHWAHKTKARRGIGTGRMRYMKKAAHADTRRTLRNNRRVYQKVKTIHNRPTTSQKKKLLREKKKKEADKAKRAAAKAAGKK